jgi:para-aminobenzoate synthetase component 1
LAGKWAGKQDADEAIILNTDGTLSETNTANILLIKDRSAICPESPHVLPGVMVQAVVGLLKEWGYHVENQSVKPVDIWEMDQMLLTNSLIGAVPVLAIDGKPLSPPDNLWQKINENIFNGA